MMDIGCDIARSRGSARRRRGIRLGYQSDTNSGWRRLARFKMRLRPGAPAPRSRDRVEPPGWLQRAVGVFQWGGGTAFYLPTGRWRARGSETVTLVFRGRRVVINRMSPLDRLIHSPDQRRLAAMCVRREKADAFRWV